MEGWIPTLVSTPVRLKIPAHTLFFKWQTYNCGTDHCLKDQDHQQQWGEITVQKNNFFSVRRTCDELIRCLGEWLVFANVTCSTMKLANVESSDLLINISCFPWAERRICGRVARSPHSFACYFHVLCLRGFPPVSSHSPRTCRSGETGTLIVCKWMLDRGFSKFDTVYIDSAT